MIVDPEAKLRQIFEAVDVNRDGNINKREMIKFCRSSPDLAALLGFPEGVRQEDGSRDILEMRFQAIDRDDDREVTWEEFRDFFMAEMASERYSVQHPREHRRLDHDNAKQVPTISDACAKPVAAPSPIRRYPRTPVDEAFEREFEQKHQEWSKRDEKRRLAEEEARQAGVRAVQRLLEELSDNPFELIPRASELSAETLAEHLTTDVAQTLRALHKESARNLERLKFHVRLSSPEQGSEFQATPKANSAVGDAEPEAEAIPGDTPCVRPSGDQPAVADVEEDNEFAEAKAPSWALPDSRPVSTPDVHREGLEASWASKPSQIENGKTQSLSEELESEARASAPSKMAEGASHQGTEHVEMKAYQVGSDTLTGKKRCMEDWMNQDSSLVIP